MPRDARTNVVVQAEAKGLDKLMRQVTGLNQKNIDGLKAQAQRYDTVRKSIDNMRSKLAELGKEQLSAMDKMSGLADKTSTEFKKQQEQLLKSRDAAKLLTQQIKLLQQAHAGDAAAASRLHSIEKSAWDLRQKQRGSFSQGFFQSAMPGTASLFLQRGPGMYRQMAGQAVGGMVGGVGRGLGAAAFTGIPGMQQALQALPGGGVLSGLLGTSAAYAQQALGFQRQRLELAPFLGQTRESTARARLERQRAPLEQKYRRDLWEQRQIAKDRRRRDVWEEEQTLQDQGMPTWQAKIIAARKFKGKPLEIAPIPVSGALIQLRKRAELERQRGQRESLTGMGAELRGLGVAETTQELGGLVQTGGGTLQGAQQQGIARRALAARTAFGVGYGVSGAFLGAGRRGGVVGGRGAGGEAFQQVLANAVELGLEGSEIVQYMQEMAQGISQFATTGIQINPHSIHAIAGSMSGLGVAGTRATRMAQGLSQYTQGVPRRGIKGGMDLMLMQMAGYTGKGGAAEVEKTFMAMEEMRTSGKMAPELISNLIKMGGGGAGGRLFARQAMAGVGMEMSTQEMALVGKQLEGGTLSKEEQKMLATERTRREAGAAAAQQVQTPAQLESMARTMITTTAPAARQQAALQNKQLEVGNRMIGVVKTMEMNAARMTNAFSRLAGGENSVLDKVVLGLESFAKAVEGMAAAEGTLNKMTHLFKSNSGLGE